MPFFYLSETNLTVDDLGQVLEEIVDVSAQWYPLGLQLQVRVGTLDRIQTQFPDPRRQLLEMLKTWLTTGDNTSWRNLIDALRSRSVGESQLASVLERRHCLMEETEMNSVASASESWPVTDIASSTLVLSEQTVPTPPPQVTGMQESK